MFSHIIHGTYLDCGLCFIKRDIRCPLSTGTEPSVLNVACLTPENIYIIICASRDHEKEDTVFLELLIIFLSIIWCELVEL